MIIYSDVQIPKTIKELKIFMVENCFNLESYSIDGNIINEGLGLEKWGELFIWFYVERGKKENVTYFRTEEEAVKYAFNIIVNDKFATSNLIAYIQNTDAKNKLVKDLESRFVNYWVDEIPFWDKKRYRVFVVGCDINKVKDLTVDNNKSK